MIASDFSIQQIIEQTKSRKLYSYDGRRARQLGVRGHDRLRGVPEVPWHFSGRAGNCVTAVTVNLKMAKPSGLAYARKVLTAPEPLF